MGLGRGNDEELLGLQGGNCLGFSLCCCISSGCRSIASLYFLSHCHHPTTIHVITNLTVAAVYFDAVRILHSLSKTSK